MLHGRKGRSFATTHPSSIPLSIPLSRPRRSMEQAGRVAHGFYWRQLHCSLTAAVFLLVQVEVSGVVGCLGEAHGGCAVAVTDKHLTLVVGTCRVGGAVRAPRAAPSQHQAPGSKWGAPPLQGSLPSHCSCVAQLGCNLPSALWGWPASQFFAQQSVPIQATGCQLLQNTVGDSVKCFAEI